MSKVYDGRPSAQSLKTWSTYGQLGTEAEEPTRENTSPTTIHLDGSNNPASWSKGDPKQHSWPRLAGGAGSGEARVKLAKTQANRRGA
jgi:hypothetical protein